MGIKFKQIDNLQNTFDSVSGGLQSEINSNSSSLHEVSSGDFSFYGHKYFNNNVDFSGAQGILVSSNNIYTPNDIFGNRVKIGYPLSDPRNSTPAPLGALQVSGGQIYLEDQLNIRNNSSIIIENGSITGGTGNFSKLTGVELFLESGDFSKGLTVSGKVGIGTNAPEGILDISSTSSAPIMPRMTTAQMNAIPNPVEGMIIYNTESGKFAGRESGGWATISSIQSSSSSLTSSEITRLQDFLSFWSVQGDGSLLPTGNNAQDIGSASLKIRDIFEHTS